jgi:hypothetical protein
LAGLAAGLVATGAIAADRAVRRLPRLDLYIDGERRDLALIDVATSHQAWIGARALWDVAQLSEIVLSRVTPSEIGLCSLGGLLFPEAAGRPGGAYIAVGPGERSVLAPLAPGLIRRVPVAAARLLAPDERVELRGEPCTIALDGEREIEIVRAGHCLEVALRLRGPRVVDIAAALQAGASSGAFIAAT